MPPTVLQTPLPPSADSHASEIRRISVQDFEAMTESANASELIQGIPQRLIANNPIHAETSSQIACLVRNHLSENSLPLRVLCGEVGVVIRDGESGTVRAADLAVISKERLPELPKSGFLRVMPELLVEIISGSNTWTDTFEKIYGYFEGGAKLVWIVDPAMQEVRVFKSPAETDLLRSANNSQLTGGDVIPGFSVPVSVLFAV